MYKRHGSTLVHDSIPEKNSRNGSKSMTKTLSHVYNQNNKDKLVQNYGSSSNSPTKVRKMAKTGT